ncbi:MAG: cytochrome c [Gemmatimonadales bacterium]
MSIRVVTPIIALGLLACGGKPDSAAALPDQQGAAPATTTTAADSPGVDPAVMAQGQEGYAICQTCHQADGQGLAGTYPPLAGSDFVNGPAERMIAIVLHGLNGPVTVGGNEYNNVMAPWGALPDDQIAATVTYVRHSFGNRGSVVTPADVAAVRRATEGRTTPWTVTELMAAVLR